MPVKVQDVNATQPGPSQYGFMQHPILEDDELDELSELLDIL